MLLNIFHSGALVWALSLFFLGLAGWFGYQTNKAHNSGWEQLTQDGHLSTGDEKIPIFKIPTFWFMVATLVIWVVCLLLIASDYKGV
jgi:hypothetical protein